MKHIKFLLPFLLILAATLTPPAFAQDKSVVVERRDADMTVNKDGSVDVLETWVVNFQGGPFHYAFRSIPLNKISAVDFQGVTENDQAYERSSAETANTFEVQWAEGERQLTWYFSPTTNQTRTFELHYRLADALRIYDSGDQFWWKFVELGRVYSITAAKATVHLPSQFDASQIVATTYTGPLEEGGARVVDGQTVEFTGGPFEPDVEWEIRVQFPHGVVTQAVQPWQQIEQARLDLEAKQARAAQQFAFYSLASTLLILIGGALAFLLLWYLRGRDQATALPAEFLNAPPDEPPGSGKVLTPALAGTLIDEEANVRDVLSTLIDWAQRGIIHIRALPGGSKTADVNDDYAYEKIGANAPPLQYQYERELMQRLWAGETTRSMGMIRAKFTDSLDTMFNALYDELVRLGYFETRPDRVRVHYYRYGWLLLVLTAPAAFLFQIFVGDWISPELPFSLLALAPWIALALAAAAGMVLSRYMPRKTPMGAQAAARWHAFRRYLENIEKYTNVADAKEQFEKYLPYAIAFGIDKTWVQKFAAVDTPAPAWYTPPAFTRVTTSTTTPSTTSPSHPFPGGVLSASDVSGTRGGTGAPTVPSLNDAASGAFTSLNNVSASLFSMLNTTATSFVASNPSLSPGSSSYRSGSSSSSSWHSSSSSSSHSSFSGGSSHSGGGGGGGHSGFG